MRWFFVFLGLTIFVSAGMAQEQEDKLVDRLLRPNMNLSNSNQNKKFNAVEGTSVNRKFAVRDFYAGRERPMKSFGSAKSFPSPTFWPGKARAEAAADAKANAELAFATTEFKTRQSRLIHKSPLADKRVRVRSYADNRPFLAKGTRQKILDQQHEEHPLTIDEVRELLNKSR